MLLHVSLPLLQLLGMDMYGLGTCAGNTVVLGAVCYTQGRLSLQLSVADAQINDFLNVSLTHTECRLTDVNDKMSKLKGIVFGQWAICKGQNTVDYEDSPLEPGIKILYKPMGVIGCVMPSTNPVATIIGNAMI